MDLSINRRGFVTGVVAAGALGALPASLRAAPTFAPSRFSVVVRGSGRDVILIPGLTAGRDIWNGLVAALPGYRYHLVQVAGFAGEAARGNVRGPILSGIAEELSRYIAVNRLAAPALVGHSMGGTIAMMLAARHPRQVGRLMVVDMLPQPSGLFGSSPDQASSMANMVRNLSGTPGGRSLVASLMGMFGDSRQSDPDVTSRAVGELADLDLGPELPRIVAPMTVVYASPDPQQRTITDRRFAAAYRSRPGTKLVRIDGSGHMIMFDQPARFGAQVRSFLSER
jgi:pimeloyl-ACP methyl ester carboxylesterase